MEGLVRTQTGQFEIGQSVTLSQLEAMWDEGRVKEILISVEEIFSKYPAVLTRREADRLAWNGNPVKTENVDMEEVLTLPMKEGAKVRLYDSEKRFIGIYELSEDGQSLKVWKMFRE